MNSTAKVCGKFQQTQLASPLPKPLWKRWLSAAAVFVAVFIGIKEASAQQSTLADKIDSTNKFKPGVMGEVVVVGYSIPKSLRIQKIYALNEVEVLPSFPGGDRAFIAYLFKNIHLSKTISQRVILSFNLSKYGILTDVKISNDADPEISKELTRILKETPQWNPGIKEGKAVDVAYTLPVTFN